MAQADFAFPGLLHPMDGFVLEGLPKKLPFVLGLPFRNARLVSHITGVLSAARALNEFPGVRGPTHCLTAFKTNPRGISHDRTISRGATGFNAEIAGNTGPVPVKPRNWYPLVEEFRTAVRKSLAMQLGRRLDVPGSVHDGDNDDVGL